MVGARYDMGICLMTVVIALTAGSAIGVIGGYYGGAVDMVVSRLVEIF